MGSSIDPGKPADGVPSLKADLRNNIQAAKDEIEALQIGKADVPVTAAQIQDGAVTVAKISAAGEPSSSTFLRGDGAWGTPSASAVITSETITASKTYAVGDFPTDQPLFIFADPTSAQVDIVLPPLLDYGLSTTQVRQLAVIRAVNSLNAVSLAIAAPASGRLRSQPGTTGWSPTTQLVYIGASLTLADEAVVTVDGMRSLINVDGLVRAAP